MDRPRYSYLETEAEIQLNFFDTTHVPSIDNLPGRIVYAQEQCLHSNEQFYDSHNDGQYYPLEGTKVHKIKSRFDLT